MVSYAYPEGRPPGQLAWDGVDWLLVARRGIDYNYILGLFFFKKKNIKTFIPVVLILLLRCPSIHLLLSSVLWPWGIPSWCRLRRGEGGGEGSPQEEEKSIGGGETSA